MAAVRQRRLAANGQPEHTEEADGTACPGEDAHSSAVVPAVLTILRRFSVGQTIRARRRRQGPAP